MQHRRPARAQVAPFPFWRLEAAVCPGPFIPGVPHAPAPAPPAPDPHAPAPPAPGPPAAGAAEAPAAPRKGEQAAEAAAAPGDEAGAVLSGPRAAERFCSDLAAPSWVPPPGRAGVLEHVSGPLQPPWPVRLNACGRGLGRQGCWPCTWPMICAQPDHDHAGGCACTHASVSPVEHTSRAAQRWREWARRQRGCGPAAGRETDRRRARSGREPSRPTLRQPRGPPAATPTGRCRHRCRWSARTRPSTAWARRPRWSCARCDAAQGQG